MQTPPLISGQILMKDAECINRLQNEIRKNHMQQIKKRKTKFEELPSDVFWVT